MAELKVLEMVATQLLWKKHDGFRGAGVKDIPIKG